MQARKGFAPALALALLVLCALLPASARAHCDSLDGPVVKAAQRALASGDLAPVLAWVKPEGEAEVRAAFDKALAVRKLGPDAQEVADRYFLETAVRVHRESEGEPYTGIKPAGTAGATVMAADRALGTGRLGEVTDLLVAALRSGLTTRFEKARAVQPPSDDVADGREYVEAYVGFIHYVEGLQAAIAGQSEEARAQPAAARAP